MAADRATELRNQRLAFERAMRDGVTIADAQRALAEQSWTDADRRLANRRCGTVAPVSAAEPGDEGRPLQWWQK
jgi:hypothetical protein